MRTAVASLALLGCATARWVRWTHNDDDIWVPQKTDAPSADTTVGWTPKPTPAPGYKSPADEIIDVLRRQDSGSTTFTNSKTCGYISDKDSNPLTCDDGYTCSTSTGGTVVIDCIPIGSQIDMFVSCINGQGDGSQKRQDTKTCHEASAPNCATYTWTSSAGNLQTIRLFCNSRENVHETMIGMPLNMLDMLSSTTTTNGDSSTGTSSTAEPTSSSGTAGDDNNSGNSSSSNNNTGAIVGGVVGGVAGVAILAGLAFFLILRHNKNKGAAQQGRSIGPSEIMSASSGGMQQQHHQGGGAGGAGAPFIPHVSEAASSQSPASVGYGGYHPGQNYSPDSAAAAKYETYQATAAAPGELPGGAGPGHALNPAEMAGSGPNAR